MLCVELEKLGKELRLIKGYPYKEQGGSTSTWDRVSTTLLTTFFVSEFEW